MIVVVKNNPDFETFSTPIKQCHFSKRGLMPNPTVFSVHAYNYLLCCCMEGTRMISNLTTSEEATLLNVDIGTE